MQKIIGLAEDGSVISPHLARLAGANLAFGSKIAVKSLEKKLRHEFDFGAFCRSIGTTIAEATPADRWLALGEHGKSSQAIYAAMHVNSHQYQEWGTKAGWPHPLDADDLRRCLLYLRATEGEISIMSGKSPYWDVLVDHWGELEKTFSTEFPAEHWEEGEGSAQKTNALLKKILGDVHG